MTYQEAIESLKSTENMRSKAFGEDDSSVQLARDIRTALTCKRLHIIPAGGSEPIHHAHEGCWCCPLAEEDGRMLTHNAKDGRERWERNNKLTSVRKEGCWVLIYQGG